MAFADGDWSLPFSRWEDCESAGMRAATSASTLIQPWARGREERRC